MHILQLHHSYNTFQQTFETSQKSVQENKGITRAFFKFES